MPDTTAITMTSADAQPKAGPALSATSDAPVIQAQEADQTEVTDVVVDAPADDVVVEAKEAKEDKTDPAVKAAITKERNRRREAEERAAKSDAERAQLAAALEALTKKPEPVAADRPKRDEFNDPDAYEQALEQYISQKAAAEAVAKDRQRQANDVQEKQTQQVFKTYADSVEAFKADHADFDEVFTDDLPVTAAMTSAILNADNGAELAYWLGKNPDEAQRISELAPAKQVYEMGRISAKLSTPAPVVHKPKPAPLRPISTRSGPEGKSPEEMSTDEYAAYRNAQLKASNGHATAH